MLLLFVVSMGLQACRKEDPEDEEEPFDRAAMLTNIADNVIIPAYEQYQTDVASLKTAADAFTASPTASSLTAVKTTLSAAYHSWVACSAFEYGPADDLNLRSNANTFPVDTAVVEDNVGAGSFNLALASNIDAKGLPALDYLLHGPNSTLADYTTDADASNRKQYLTTVVDDLKSTIDQVVTDWSASGSNYRATFIASDGVDVGSSLGMIVNEMNFDHEILKNARIGIPLGKKSLGSPLPEKVEGYYAGNSASLANAHIAHIEQLYLGGSGSGLDDYLVHLDAKHGSASLNDAIKDQFDALQAALALVPDPMSAEAQAQSQAMENAYEESKTLVTLLKTDMPSAMSILITYQDNDGD